LAAAKIAGNLKVVLKKGEISVEPTGVPDRPIGFALLELIVAGICNTDLELQRGYYNFQGTPGHEFVARVVGCDNPTLLGRRVVGEINIACGECDFCRGQMGRHCRNRSVLGILNHQGAFSHFFTLPEQNLYVLPDSVLDEEAVFVEPLAAACEILDQVALEPGTQVAVLGDGKLGLLVSQVLLAHHLDVTLYGRHESKLALARAAGASAASASNLPEAAYACVVECSGSSEGLASAIRMTRPRGTVVMKSTVHDKVSIDMAPVIVNEISLVGSRCGRFEPALSLLESRKVSVSPMIQAEFLLAEAPRAFEIAATRGVLKVLLRP
jgi:alcohol dehydrogenase